MKKVLIIGSGPAGVSLALYLKRSNVDVSVITNNNSMLLKAGQIENYYGVGQINGKELYEKGLKQLIDIGIEVINEEVVKIEKYDDFHIYTDKNKYLSDILVLANGIVRTPSGIKNASEYEGKGLSYCASCDGYFFKNKKIAVIGNGNLAYEEITQLKNISNNLTLFTNSQEMQRNFNDLDIEINKEKIDEIVGDQKVEGIKLSSGEIIEIDGIFIGVGIASSTTFSKTLGIIMNGSYIKVDENYMTNIDGLYAVGDVIGGTLQIGKAVSDGIIASKKIIEKSK